METWHIQLSGQVQGVGFRPFIYHLAHDMRLTGWVNNSGDGVHIELNASRTDVDLFCERIYTDAPRLAKVTKLVKRPVMAANFIGFNIHLSSDSKATHLLLAPDFALCETCAAEFNDRANNRFQYPFITCIHCGPRYSITEALPFDRKQTVMDDFDMCPSCLAEYSDPSDRRYHSQTNSCPNCAIAISTDSTSFEGTETSYIVAQIHEYWRSGKTVAIKGIGGFLLTVDATNLEAISTLRKRKKRPRKPFAVMFSDLEAAEKIVHLNSDEKTSLQSHVSPVVVADLKTTTFSTLPTDIISPGLKQLGVLLPYAPLFHWLLSSYPHPIVATSGNLSSEPIVFENNYATKSLAKIADQIVYHNRDISIPLDDSVVKYSRVHRRKIIVRRARGLAPTYFSNELLLLNRNILATGAILKSTFSLLHARQIYVSQYLGDLQNYATERSYELTLQHLTRLLRTEPTLVLVDLHPQYPSTLFGRKLARDKKLPIHQIQHHEAHFSAILGEHCLIDSPEPILGVVFDGTGLGTDGNIWGGEFFKYEDYQFSRCYYFGYYPHLAGDKMAREPRLSALSACWDVMGSEELLKPKFSVTEWTIYKQLLQTESSILTSSLGRIFDAVACLLGLADKQSYEGEAAMLLEELATGYFNRKVAHDGAFNFSSSYFREGTHNDQIPTKSLMTNIVLDLKKGFEPDFIAAKFHYSLAKLIGTIAGYVACNSIAFSGGVFQNGLLVDLITELLSTQFKLYWHVQLSPNDENISFGQIMHHHITEKKLIHIKNRNHVFSGSS